MNEARGRRLTIGQTETYQIKVPGEIDFGKTDWVADLVVTVEPGGDVGPATVLTGELDQAALHGLLRQIYTLGLPLISVTRLGAR